MRIPIELFVNVSINIRDLRRSISALAKELNKLKRPVIPMTLKDKISGFFNYLRSSDVCFENALFKCNEDELTEERRVEFIRILSDSVDDTKHITSKVKAIPINDFIKDFGKTKCPNCNKKLSFTKERNMYHCKSCGLMGDHFSFIQELIGGVGGFGMAKMIIKKYLIDTDRYF